MEALHLTPSERGEIQICLRKRNLPASVAQRMRIILLLDEGASYSEIREQLGAFPSNISRWKQRYEQDGLLGLATDAAVASEGTGEDAAAPQMAQRTGRSARWLP